MKNKEIEELLNTFKELINTYSPDTEPFTIDYDYEIKYSALESLLSYIEQLEKKPNKALDFIHKNSYKKGDGTIMYDTDIQKLEDILKGGSDE